MTAIRPLLSGWPCPWLTVFGRVNERSMLSSLAGVWIPRLTHLLSLYRGRGDRVATADATWFVRSKCAKTISFTRTTYYCHPPPLRSCAMIDSRVWVSWPFVGEASEMYAIIFNDQTKYSSLHEQAKTHRLINNTNHVQDVHFRVQIRLYCLKSK